MKKFLWTICSISYLFISPTSFAGKIEEAEINGFMAFLQRDRKAEWDKLGDIHPAFKVARLAAEEARRDVPPVIKVKMMRIISSALRGIGFGGINKARQATAEERLAATEVANVFGQFTTADSGSFVDAAGDAYEAAHYGVVDQLVQAGRHREPAWENAAKMEEDYVDKYGNYEFTPLESHPLQNLMTFHFHRRDPNQQASTSILMRCQSWNDVPTILDFKVDGDDLSGVYLLSDLNGTLYGATGQTHYERFQGQMFASKLDGKEAYMEADSISRRMQRKFEPTEKNNTRIGSATEGSSEKVVFAEHEIPQVIDNFVLRNGAFGLVTYFKRGVSDPAFRNRDDFYEAAPETIGKRLGDRTWYKEIRGGHANYDGKGAIVTTGNEKVLKGEFLESFVHEGGLPDTELVVFLDDVLEQDISVYQHLIRNNIPVISCFYAPIMTPPEARVAYAKDPRIMVANPKPTVRRKWQPAGRSASTGMGSGAAAASTGTVSGAGAASIGKSSSPAWPASRRHPVTTPLNPPFAR